MRLGPLISANDALAWVDRAVFLDARAGADARGAYATAHVPRAIHVDLETDLSRPGDPAVGGRHPLPSIGDWLSRLGDWGVTPSTPVIVYDAAGGGMAAARAWWMLRAIGHQALAVVDGGWPALRDAGVRPDSGLLQLTPIAPYRSALERWPIVDADSVERVRRDPGSRLIDARAPDRYAGRTEPLDPVAGHIPGAHNLYWQSQLDGDGLFEPLTGLRGRYMQILDGVAPDQVVCYCGSGVTACHIILAMEACGLTGARLYLGSWSEWCRQERPRAAD